MKKKIFYCVSLFVVVSITQFYLPDLGIAGRYNIIGYQDNETERINHPHLCAQIGGNTSNFVIAQQPASGDIKDESMKNFLKIDDCHTAADGSGIVVMVIDIPVDYRHDIFDQDGYSSLSQENCYLIECDYENNIATQIIPAPIYTGDFVDNFNAYYSGPELIDTDMYHGTAVAGLVKQIAPYSTIISMGPLVAIGDELVDAHVMAFNWAKDYIIAGNSIDIITISSYGDSSDNDLNVEFVDAVNDLVSMGVLFTMSVDYVEGSNLGTDSLYGAMGNYPGVIGVGRIYDEGINMGERGDNGHNHANHPDYMDLELMASGYDLTSAWPIEDGEANLYVTNLDGNSFATPIIAGATALIKDLDSGSGITNIQIENRLRDLAIHPSYFDSGHDEDWYKTHYGYGILNIAGSLKIGDFDNDGVTDYDEKYTYDTLLYDSDYDNDGLLDGEEINGVYAPSNPYADPDGYIRGLNPKNDDTDGDQLSDYDEIYGVYAPTNQYADAGYIRNLNPINDDSDGDNLLDSEEIFIYETNPGNADSDLDGLNDWEEVNEGLDGYETDPNDSDSDDDDLIDGEEFNYGSNPHITDTDNDGLTDGDEVYIYGTHPANKDTDDDDLKDGWELSNSFNPLVNDANQDPDLDGATNLEEYTHNTDPYDSDTDEDGMEDGWEMDYSLNPLVDDSMGDADGDGLYNIDEFVNDCDPTNTDTDNDGLNDKQEILNQCDPNDSDTDNDGWTDGFEVYTSGTEPDDADTDNDGLTDKNEFNYWKYTRGRSTSQAYTYCCNDDVDNDNAKDGTELSWGTDPLNNDTDGDGLYDGSEDIYYDTDPTDYDSDNDGYNDGEEVAAGTDPNDPNDHPGSSGGGGFGW